MKTIFAVDDDKTFLDKLSHALHDYDYQLDSAQRIDGAFERAKKARPDCLLLDVMLPDGSGYHLSRQVRRDPELYKTPILFISTLGDSPEVHHALNQGADFYLTKPFSLNQLIDCLEKTDILSKKIQDRSSSTGLMGMEAMAREVDHRIFREEPFALCYISIENFTPYAINRGEEGANAVIQWLAKKLRKSAESLDYADARVAHLGRDHFLALLREESCRRFCRETSALFSEKVPEFYKDFEVEGGYTVAIKHRGSFSGYRLMSLHIDVARWRDNNFTNAHEMLRQLCKVRKDTSAENEQTLFRWDQDKKW